MPLTPDGEEFGTRLPVADLDTLADADPVERLAGVVAERHDNLVDAVTAQLGRMERAILGTNRRLDLLIGMIETLRPDVAALRRDLDALARRVEALEKHA